MNKINFKESYKNWSEQLKKKENTLDDAMKKAIGGEFESIGNMEKDLLIQCGLKNNDYIIDVGCGSGRLAFPLSKYLDKGKYYGTDVVDDFLDYAANLTQNDNFKFELTDGFSINEEDNKVDMICFFSVFTHLLHEETFNYLREAKRVLKPNGKIVFSFLEFYIPSHWNVFEYDIEHLGDEKHLNVFFGRDAISAWANHLNLEIESIFDGDKPFINLSNSITKEDGTVFENKGALGQSVCVLIKR